MYRFFNAMELYLTRKVMELVLPCDPAAAARTKLWRFRKRVTFERFKACFELINSRADSHYPVISAVLKYESRLSLVKYAADIIVWQAVLFKYLKSGSITREEASLITNKQFIEQYVPSADQRHAFAKLENYCVAFNATITQPDPLFECAPNIFAHHGKVDLYQDKGVGMDVVGSDMNLQTSIAFSLPNRQKKRVEQLVDGKWTIGDEFVDPRGLCTISILDFLQVNGPHASSISTCLFFFDFVFSYANCLHVVHIYIYDMPVF